MFVNVSLNEMTFSFIWISLQIHFASGLANQLDTDRTKRLLRKKSPLCNSTIILESERDASKN